MVVHEGKRYHIVPYHRLTNDDVFDPKAKTSLKVEWRPILSEMMKANHGLDMRGSKPTESEVRYGFKKAIRHLQKKFSLLFEMPEETLTRWTVGTWSKWMRRSRAMTHGTKDEKRKVLRSVLGKKYMEYV